MKKLIATTLSLVLVGSVASAAAPRDKTTKTNEQRKSQMKQNRTNAKSGLSMDKSDAHGKNLAKATALNVKGMEASEVATVLTEVPEAVPKRGIEYTKQDIQESLQSGMESHLKAEKTIQNEIDAARKAGDREKIESAEQLEVGVENAKIAAIQLHQVVLNKVNNATAPISEKAELDGIAHFYELANIMTREMESSYLEGNAAARVKYAALAETTMKYLENNRNPKDLTKAVNEIYKEYLGKIGESSTPKDVEKMREKVSKLCGPKAGGKA